MKILRPLVISALSSLLTISQLIFYPNIKSVVAQQNSSCQEAISSSEIRLIGDRPQDAIRPSEGTIIVENPQNLNLRTRIIDISQDYRGYPPDRFLMVYFTMSGSRGDDIMNSPKMMQEISQTIVSNCSNFGGVSFGIWNSHNLVYGRLDGQVIPFRCGNDITSPDERRAWGLQGCY